MVNIKKLRSIDGNVLLSFGLFVSVSVLVLSCSGLGGSASHWISADIFIGDDGSISGEIHHSVCDSCALTEAEPTGLPTAYFFLGPKSENPLISTTSAIPSGSAIKVNKFPGLSASHADTQVFINKTGSVGPVRDIGEAFPTLKLDQGDLLCQRQSAPQAPAMPGVAYTQPSERIGFYGNLFCRSSLDAQPRFLAQHVVGFSMHSGGVVSFDKLSDSYVSSLATAAQGLPAWGLESEKYILRPSDGRPVYLGKGLSVFEVGSNGTAAGSDGRSLLFVLQPNQSAAITYDIRKAKIGEYDRSNHSQLGVHANGTVAFGLQEEGRMRICAWSINETTPRCFFITPNDLPE